MLRTALAALLAAGLLAPLAVMPGAGRFVVPNFQDLTIKTRRTYGLQPGTVTTLFLKGPRERMEHRPELATANFVSPFWASIMQCDQKTYYRLNERSKTYTSMPFPEQFRERPGHVRKQRASGAEVTVTFDSVDTGERRQERGYEARHVKTTIRVEPSKGASSKPSKTEIDGWYIDLPGLNCRDNAGQATAWLTAWPAGRPDRVIFKPLGTVPRGFAIEETSRKTGAGNVIVDKTELLEFSEQPLDESLFEVPSDYLPAPEPERQILPR